MNKSYDVIVIGGGPAGSMAARFAATGGASTLLVEKHPVIGQPLCCGEAISTTGLTDLVELKDSWINSVIHKAKMYGPEGVKAKILHPNAGYVLDRRIFDNDLAKMAEEAGAEVRTEVDIVDLVYVDNKITGVKAISDGKSFDIEAKVVIAADGVESTIARRAGIDSHLKPAGIHSACQYLLDDLEIEKDTIEFHFGNDVAPGGYVWVFPKGPDSANVGLGICPAKSSKVNALSYLNKFIESRFERYTIVKRMTGGVPTYMPDMPLYKDNLLIVGDAARLIDSLTGAGIALALLSGKIAGETAALMVGDGISGKAYADGFNEIKRKDLKSYYHFREIFLKLTDSDFISILKFTDDLFGDKKVTAINPFEVVKQILLAHPRLLKIGRHLIF